MRHTLIWGPLYMVGTGGRGLRPVAGAPRAAQGAFGTFDIAANFMATPARGPSWGGLPGC